MTRRTRRAASEGWAWPLVRVVLVAIAVTTPFAAYQPSCPWPVLPNNGINSSDMRAPNSNFRFGRAHYIITAAEMAAAGFPNGSHPTAIGWTYTVAPEVWARGNLIVYMENTSDTSNLKSTTWATAISSMAVVHNASTTLPETAGSFTVPFEGGSPFTYTGGGIYVAFDWSWSGPATHAVVACNTAIADGLKGAQSNSSAPAILVNSAMRPETILASDVVVDDLSVDNVQALGALPTALVGPQIFRAVVSNRGSSPATDLQVTLSIDGADSFNDVVKIPTLPVCSGTLTTFAAFIPGALGANTITVSLPDDDNNVNNSISKPLDETRNRYSYKHAGTPSRNGFGFANDPFALAAKFTITEPAKVSEVELEFFAVAATTYRVAIYPQVGGFPGTTPLYVDAADRPVSSNGPVVITLPTPVAVPAGSFYVGVHHADYFAGLAFDTENPVRPDTFFFSDSLPNVAWVDFSPGFNVKLNVGVKLIQCSIDADCDDSNVCTDDTCVNEICVSTNNANACRSDNPCPGPDVCAGGVCTPELNPCDDGLACTKDICDGIGGCSYTAVVCDDDDTCTSDACVELTGCVFTPNSGSACHDGDFCTIGDTCQNGVCVPGTPPPAIQFCNTEPVTIPTHDPVIPYPSAINVSGPSRICKVTVRLNGLWHFQPSEIDILLAGPGGQNAIIMSDVGGSGAGFNIPFPGIDLTLDDAAASYMFDAPPVPGTFKPTNFNFFGADSPWPAPPAPAALGSSALSIFRGSASTGSWNLWVRDEFAEGFKDIDGGISGGWCLNVVSASCQSDGDCDDSNVCNGLETCSGGICQAGTPLCDDGLFCTLDSCTPSTGECAFPPNPCDDQDLCTADSCEEISDVCVNSGGCVQFCSTSAITIPSSGPATPYPSSITVAGLAYPAVLASVELQRLHHQDTRDLDILLEGPVDPSVNVMLMSDAGGSSFVQSLAFSDVAASSVPSGTVSSGTYRPTNNDGDADAFPAPAPAWSGSLTLAAFNGNPNGTFKLYVVDDLASTGGSINRWCLNIKPSCTVASDCDDGNPCTEDTCSDGTCSSVFSTACDDFNPCTVDSCSQTDGCGYTPVQVSSVDYSLRVTKPSLGSTTARVSWTDSPGPFNLYRGSLSGPVWVFDQACFAPMVESPVDDPEVPVPGAGFYYLAAREAACGESGLGLMSNGSPRPNQTPCSP